VTCPQWIAYKYNVDYKPDIDDTNLRSQLLFQHEPILGNCHIFDGNSLLLSRRLHNRQVELVSRTLSRSIVKITLHFSKELQPTHPDCVRYYNILFRRTLRQMNLKQIGRNYYEDRSKNDFASYKLEVLPGYITSILPYENSLTLCADLSHKLLRMETAYDLIMKIFESNVRNFKEKVEKELVGLIVFTRYNNKTYRVDAVSWDQTPRDTFIKTDGSQITYVDYYWQKYNKHVTDLSQPLLVSQGRWKKGQRLMPRSPIRLVPELKIVLICKYLIVIAYFPWFDHNGNILIFRNKNAQRELKRWHFRLNADFLSVSGRTLKEVRIFQRDESADPLADWLKGSKNTSLLRAMALNDWVILYTRSCIEIAHSLLQSLRKVTPAMGMTMGRANMYEVNDNPSSYITTLQRCVTRYTQMVVCLLPDDGKNRYDEIKKYLCVQCPTPSQCVVAHTLGKPWSLLTVAAKIAQQMNCKMGGALWKVETGLEKTMFVGIDCFHDIVNRFGRHLIVEVYLRVSGFLSGALSSWFRNVPHAPQSIVVYRDGVGDGQLQALLDHEVPQLVSYLDAQSTHSTPNLTFIVVKKRINTRFFVSNTDGLGNPYPGTVIDMVLTREQWYDFYIVSQSSRTGTVTPTHYNVIYDTICLDPDTVQRLTYKLCHMYYNLPGIIRVPAPCHYAHKLAYLVGQNIHQEPDKSLSDSLYYL
uniref:Piwi-like protein 3 n=1 Tax=Sciurus vulgaris TaxID=55149 RepID=A0A8D2B2C8_SCIVU